MDTDDAGRAAFEAWYCFPLATHLKRVGDSYEFMSARTSWRSWRAGAAAERERWTTLLTEKWHSGEGKGTTLAQYLGMSAAEYAAWVADPSAGANTP